AIAVVARFPDDIDPAQLQNYRQGVGVDPLAGAEAIISHLVVRQFGIPCAHAPALSPLPVDGSISPRSAAEELGYTFLSCVLVGLSRAPRYRQQPSVNTITNHHVNAVIIPASACGGSAVLSFSQQPHTKIITVGNNTTALNVTADSLNLLNLDVVPVANYQEAIGWLVCDRAGINPESFSPKANKATNWP
ncbi:MAG: DUF3326 domain-containing protein, partial [Synechococcaceae cyanobacterium RL_1_2]|nr:DUF3326 domain-containing protein [Synechococcaceae cyanobacterium RL_1_2]